MAQLLGEELDADEEFWSHETWKEEEEDDEFSSEEAHATDGASDDADSDFDKPEEADEAVVGEEDVAREQKEEARKRKMKKGAYQDPAKKQPTKKKPKQAAAAAEEVKGEDEEMEEVAEGATQPETPKHQQTQRTLRQSTVKRSLSTFERQEKEKEDEEERRARRKSSKRRKSCAPMSQEQRLSEAAVTEEINKKSLAERLAVFEEKKVLAQRKLRPIGLGITSISRAKLDPETGKRFVENTVTFPPSAAPCFPEAMAPQTTAPPAPRVCVVTGLPAKYRDPLTGLPFANVEAFRAIRERTARAAGVQVDKQIVELSLTLEDKRNRLAQLMDRQQHRQQQQNVLASQCGG